MIKEIKYLIYILVIFLFFFFNIKYYFSDNFEKKFYRSIKNHENSIIEYSNQIVVLGNNTDNIIEYIDNNKNKSKKKYQFWKLLEND